MNRRRWRLAAALCLLAFPLETRAAALPYCPEPPDPAGWPTPARSCQSDPAFVAFRGALEKLVVPRAGPLRVLVSLDPGGRISSSCVVRAPGPFQWRARRRLGEVLDPPPASPTAPPCAANSVIDFNLGQATYETIELIQRDCERQSSSAFQLTQCLDGWQKRRGEIWIYGSTRRYRVFVPGFEAAGRRTALLACTRPRPATGSGALPPVGLDLAGVPLEDCMERQGWIEVKSKQPIKR